MHTSNSSDAVGAHNVCFAIHLRATFRLRLFGAHVLYLRCSWCTQRFIYDAFTSNVSFANIWCTRPIFAMQLVHTTFYLRYIYEQRFVCDCFVHATPGLHCGAAWSKKNTKTHRGTLVCQTHHLVVVVVVVVVVVIII